MDRAIDTFIYDNQIEINAQDINSGRTIRAAEKRYICPACGEYVTYVPPIIRNNYIWKKAFFRHLTAESDATCDLRISSSSTLSFYERVGQSLYLKPTNNQAFSLMIGFRGIGKEGILNYENNNASITILASDREKDTYHINRQTFYYDELTLLPIHNLAHDNNYRIEVENGSLNPKWADFCEGLSKYGGVFEYSSNGGKKIRKSNILSIDATYFILIHSNFEKTIPAELNYTCEGSIKLSGQLFKVGKIAFHGYLDTITFHRANSFLKNHFSIQLSRGESQLIPIWPPAINLYDTISFEVGNITNKALCFVKGSQIKPVVFQYLGSSFSNIPIDEKRIACFQLSEKEMPVSIERQFFGKNYYIKKNTNLVPAVETKLSIVDSSRQPFDFNTYEVLPNGNTLIVESTFPLSIYRTNAEETDYINIETENPVELKKIKWGDFLIFFTDVYIGTLFFTKEKYLLKKETLFSEDVIKILENDKSPRVPVEWWIYQCLGLSGIDKRLVRILVTYIKQGYMPINSKKTLLSLMKEISNESI